MIPVWTAIPVPFSLDPKSEAVTVFSSWKEAASKAAEGLAQSGLVPPF